MRATRLLRARIDAPVIPEARVLLALLRGAPMAAAPADLQPSVFVDLARRHQLDALAGAALRTTRAQALRVQLGDEAVEALHRSRLHHLVRNESLARNLADIAAAFVRVGVPMLVLKGPWLAFHAYGDPGTRPVGDIDLLVDERDYLPALTALHAVGYTETAPLPDTGAAALRRAHYAEQLRFTGIGRRPLELHFRLVNIGPPGAREDWVWSSSRPFVRAGLRLRVPGPEAMLLHLLIHANQHGFAVARLLFDVRFALAKSGHEVDAARLSSRLAALGCGPSAYHGLLLARDLAGAAVPAAWMQRLRPPALRRRLFSALWSLDRVRRLDGPHRPLSLEAPRFLLCELGTAAQKLRYVRGVVDEAGGAAALLTRALRLMRARNSRAPSPAPAGPAHAVPSGTKR